MTVEEAKLRREMAWVLADSGVVPGLVERAVEQLVRTVRGAGFVELIPFEREVLDRERVRRHKDVMAQDQVMAQWREELRRLRQKVLDLGGTL